jgi:putative transposase
VDEGAAIGRARVCVARRLWCAFSVSSSVAPDVIEYIQQQAQHHAKMSFVEEVQLLFKRHGLEYQEKYFWRE